MKAIRFGGILKKIYHNLFIVALETGMRAGEITGLQWEDIDFHNKLAHVRHSMTYFSNSEGKYVFELHSAKTNKRLQDIPLTAKAIKALRQQYFVKHTFATRRLEAEVPLKTVSALLGHTQLQLTTDLYMTLRRGLYIKECNSMKKQYK